MSKRHSEKDWKEKLFYVIFNLKVVLWSNILPKNYSFRVSDTLKCPKMSEIQLKWGKWLWSVSNFNWGFCMCYWQHAANHWCSHALVWIAEKTLVVKNQNKVFILRLWLAWSIVINEIRMKWKLKSSPFNWHMFRYIRTSTSREISTLKGDGNLTGRVSFLQSKLVWAL